MDVYYFTPNSGTIRGKKFIVGIDENKPYNDGLSVHECIADWEDRYLASFSIGRIQAIELDKSGKFKKNVDLLYSDRLTALGLAKFFLNKNHHKEVFRNNNDVCTLIGNEESVTSLKSWKLKGSD
jgi:hypothetical protein